MLSFKKLSAFILVPAMAIVVVACGMEADTNPSIAIPGASVDKEEFVNVIVDLPSVQTKLQENAANSALEENEAELTEELEVVEKDVIEEKQDAPVVEETEGKEIPEEDRLSFQEKTIEEVAATENDSVYLDIPNMEQNPELPTGCEAVAATIVMNYYGAGLSKTELVDNYLPYADSPSLGFVGSPYEQPNGHGHWCTAAPITVAMNNAFAARGLGRTAVNVSGAGFEIILGYVKNGQPVVFWGLENMAAGYHTLALIGYDRNAGVCYFADPLKSGIQTYSMDATRNAYQNRGKQAVVVQ